jgi:hypothetical protein
MHFLAERGPLLCSVGHALCRKVGFLVPGEEGVAGLQKSDLFVALDEVLVGVHVLFSEISSRRQATSAFLGS